MNYSKIKVCIKTIINLASLFILIWGLNVNSTFAQTTYSSVNVPVTIDAGNADTYTSTLSVGDAVSIADIDVVLDIAHTYISDLTIRLTSPDNTTVTLLSGPCFDEDNIMATLDDEGTAVLACPPTDSGSYQPSGNLSDFDTKSATGTWTLTIIDNASGDGGSLDAWSIIITAACSVTAPTLSLN